MNTEYPDFSPSYPPAFLCAMNRLLRDEGGYSKYSDDPGGETHFGISKREYPDLDIAGLTREEAAKIYYRDWWMRYGYSDLPGPIGAKLFDLAVNIGPEHATRCLQRALRACGRAPAEDGMLGPETRKGAASANQMALMAALRAEAAAYYRVLAAGARGAAAESDRKFIEGWLNRAYE